MRRRSSVTRRGRSNTESGDSSSNGDASPPLRFNCSAWRSTASSSPSTSTGLWTSSPHSYSRCKSGDETFCDCLQRGVEKECKCGEEDKYFEWVWDGKSCSAACFLREDLREVVFHNDYSCGTAGVRGNQAMQDEQYFWEIKMVSPVYGTDMMIGVGTMHLDLNKYRHSFCSLLGRDEESWGLSYLGEIYHCGARQPYTDKFGQGTIIGVHLNMWNGTLSFFKNRQPLGVAYRGLKGKTLFPVVSSTAARSGMKVISCRSVRTSLQFMCCQVLRDSIPDHMSVLESLKLPPGLKLFLENNMGWLLQSVPACRHPSSRSRKRQRGEEQASDSGKMTRVF